MKVAELEGEKLAEWVARAQDWVVERDSGGSMIVWLDKNTVHSFGRCGYRPDFNWMHGGAVVDKLLASGHWQIEPWVPEFGIGEGNTVMLRNYDDVFENYDERQRQLGDNDMEPASILAPTVLIAACRALVFSVYGAEVPDSLLPQQEG